MSREEQPRTPKTLPRYAAAADPGRLVWLLCKQKCLGMRWAEMHQQPPPGHELRAAHAFDYDATCLRCDGVAHDPYKWGLPSTPPKPYEEIKVSTEKRTEANRRNAQKSTGPRTAAGKARSSQNAVRYGLLAKRTLLSGESEGELTRLRDGMRRSLRPVGEFEEELAEKMVSAVWRKRRADGVEQGLWDSRGMVSGGKATLVDVFFLDSRHDHSIEKLTRYSIASNNEFARCFKMLKEAQELRRSSDEEAWTDPEAVEFEEDGEIDARGDDSSEDEGGSEGDDGGGNDDDSGGGPGAGGAPAGPGSSSPEGEPVASDQDGQGSGPPGPGRLGSTDPLEMGSSSTEFARKERRWTDLTDAEKALYAVRNRDRIEEFDEMLSAALENPMLLERLPVRDLLKVHERFNDTVWQTMEGIDRLLREGGEAETAKSVSA